MCPGVGGLEQHETKAAQKRQKQQRVWDRSSRSNVRCGGQLQTWPGQRFPSMHIWSISGNAICICCNSTAPGERTELRCELRSHTLSDSLVETPHPPLENHRTVSSRWHSQDFLHTPFFSWTLCQNASSQDVYVFYLVTSWRHTAATALENEELRQWVNVVMCSRLISDTTVPVQIGLSGAPVA